MNNRLILIEGLCGTGKTTTAGQLTSYLNSHGCPAVFYDEGAFPHPASLNGHANLTLSEYDNLLRAFPDNAELLRSLAITEEGAVLIPYNGDVISQNEALQTRLRERELCWTNTPVAGLSAFSGAIQRSWARLAASPAMEGLVHVLEGVFLQHPIHDLTRLYHCAYTDIESQCWKACFCSIRSMT